MSPADSSPTILGRADFLALVDAIAAAVAERVRLPVLLSQEEAWAHLGISRAAFFRLKGTTGFPREVNVEGSGVRYRRADLDTWADRLKTGRRRNGRNPK